VLVHELVRTSEEVAGESGRREKVRLLADLLRRVDPEEAPVAAAYLSGSLPQGKVGVGPATLDAVLPTPPAPEPSLSLAEVNRTLDRIADISGAGSLARREEALAELLSRATAAEQAFLARLLVGELRQGAQEGLVVEALAEASGATAEAVRRAVMLEGDAVAVAGPLLRDGPDALERFGLQIFSPVQPMLAQTADGAAEALDRLGPAAVEYKFDGARLQAHRSGGDVRVFTRRLNDVTDALPEVVEAVRALPVREVVLDGEALALRTDGRPRPFQVTMRRFGRKEQVETLRRELPLSSFFFDCLHLDGESLLDRPLEDRIRALEDAAGPEVRVPRIVTGDPDEARAFLEDALRRGHEGILIKDLAAPYSAGRRGRAWLKVKPTHTADLVVLGAEWGHGRRQGWLSNLHLGARDPGADGFAMVGKTFKGMTDEMLEWQTGRLLELELERRGNAVLVRPELVAEVAFDGVQRSPTYESGLALRFARVKGYRPDKGPEDADSLERLREIREGRFQI